MEEHRDEHLTCAECGAPFVFGADEAAVFAQRGLAPPKRCKDCRRARKARPQGGRGGPTDQAARPGRSRGGSWQAGARPRVPRYTGDVNEYRSPMQDSFAAASWNVGSWNGSGEYRSPMEDRGNRGNARNGNHPNGQGSGGRPRATHGGHHEAPRDAPRPPVKARVAAASPGPAVGPGEGGGKGARRRRGPAEKFAITCASCGAQAEVPFEPAEGREVFCPSCYRARRTAT
jgi:CxxC-x17-CxxC domain-containing protein